MAWTPPSSLRSASALRSTAICQPNSDRAAFIRSWGACRERRKRPNTFCVRSAEPEKSRKHPQWVLKRSELPCRLAPRPSTRR
jgi:hypothetical protein